MPRGWSWVGRGIIMIVDICVKDSKIGIASVYGPEAFSLLPCSFLEVKPGFP